MTNKKINREFLEKRSAYIKKLRTKAATLQALAVLFLVVGMILLIAIKAVPFESVGLMLIAIFGLFFGVCFEVSAVIYFSKAKKHLSGQTVTASSNPKDWH